LFEGIKNTSQNLNNSLNDLMEVLVIEENNQAEIADLPFQKVFEK
jgi:hypothetical protein